MKTLLIVIFIAGMFVCSGIFTCLFLHERQLSNHEWYTPVIYALSGIGIGACATAVLFLTLFSNLF